MIFAETVKEIPNALKLAPLSGEELDKYFVQTMPVRTGDQYLSPMQDILDSCHIPMERNAFLLMGHRGCGKSTELNRLAECMKQDGIPVYSIQCGQELNPQNITHTDLLILMGDALLQIADEENITLDKDLTDRIDRFWRETVTVEREKKIGCEDSAEMGSEMKLLGFFKLFAKVKIALKYNESERRTYREQVEQDLSEWIMLLKKVIDAIDEKTGNRPVLIFEDLDKLEPKSAWQVFSDYSDTLSCLPCTLIYTFPIALSYDPKFAALEGFFTTCTLPMIKIVDSDGKPYKEGSKAIEKIVCARMDKALFSEDTLDFMIKNTGGALRDLFTVITTASRRAARRESEVIERCDAELALGQIKTTLTRRIDSEYYEFLAEICNGQRERIENKEKLGQMLLAGTVLEYNGKRWHDVHPLVKEFLVEQGFVKK